MFSENWCKWLCPHIATIRSWPHSYHMVMASDCSPRWSRATSFEIGVACILHSVFQDKVLVFDVVSSRTPCKCTDTAAEATTASFSTQLPEQIQRNKHTLRLCVLRHQSRTKKKICDAILKNNSHVSDAVESNWVYNQSNQSSDNQCDLLSLNRTAG